MLVGHNVLSSQWQWLHSNKISRITYFPHTMAFPSSHG